MGKFEIRNPKSKIQNSISHFQNPLIETANELFDLSWVDEFIGKVKPYIYVREIDKLLILIPNQAYRLNDSAYYILNAVLKGHSINEVVKATGDDPDRRKELHYFFCDLRAVISGCLKDSEARKSVNYFSYKGDINCYPVLSEMAVTYRCNLKCNFCYIGEKKHPELTTKNVIRILRKIYGQARVPSVSFTGGEPLLRSDIVDLVSNAHKIGLWTNLITNATLLDKKLVKNLKKAGLSSAQVSIEGPANAIHDRITGIDGSYSATINGIELLKSEGIPVHTNTTISKLNITHLEAFVDQTRALGLTRLSMNLCIPCGTAAGHPELWVKYSEIPDHIEQVKRKASQYGIKFLWYSPVPMCFFNPIAHGFGNKSCAAVTGLLSVDPMGNVLPCSSWRAPVGSLLNDNFEKIWNSAMLSYFKNHDYAPDPCHDCTKFDMCKGACPLYWLTVGQEELVNAVG